MGVRDSKKKTKNFTIKSIHQNWQKMFALGNKSINKELTVFLLFRVHQLCMKQMALVTVLSRKKCSRSSFSALWEGTSCRETQGLFVLFHSKGLLCHRFNGDDNHSLWKAVDQSFYFHLFLEISLALNVFVSLSNSKIK